MEFAYVSQICLPKGIVMKSLTSLFLFFFFASFPVTAPIIDFIFDAGMQTGVANEIVYEGEKRISRLDWQDNISPTIGFTGNFGVRNVFLRLGVNFVIPVRSGEMENFDYLIAGSIAISHYSWHYAFLDKDFTARVEIGYISSRFDGTIHIGLFGSIYPYIRAETNDTHFLRNIHFYDMLSGGIGFNTGINMIMFLKNLNGLGFSFRTKLSRLLNLRGPAASNNTGIYTGPLIVDDGFYAGMGSNQIHFSLGVIFRR